MEEVVLLGEIVNVRGLKGEVKIMSSSSFGSYRYSKDALVILKKDEDTKELTCKSYCKSNNFDFVIFNEINCVEQANLLRGYKVYAKISSLHKLDNDSYYFYELIDMEVYDQDSRFIGKVSEVIDNPGNQILRIKSEDLEILVPFVKAFIKNVNKDEKRIDIFMMEGLI